MLFGSSSTARKFEGSRLRDDIFPGRRVTGILSLRCSFLPAARLSMRKLPNLLACDRVACENASIDAANGAARDNTDNWASPRRREVVVEFSLVLFVLWASCGFLGFTIGEEKYRPMEGLIWGLVFGPIGLMAIGFMPTAYSRKCPACLMGIPSHATRCCHCGTVVDQPVPMEVPPAA
jgi:hypothetical protein